MKLKEKVADEFYGQKQGKRIKNMPFKIIKNYVCWLDVVDLDDFFFLLSNTETEYSNCWRLNNEHA